jgi:hypothetical protein
MFKPKPQAIGNHPKLAKTKSTIVRHILFQKIRNVFGEVVGFLNKKRS